VFAEPFGDKSSPETTADRKVGGVTMNANEESPSRLSGVRQEPDGSILSSDIASRPARYSWIQLCMISSVGLAVGVVGTAAYMLWFSRDQQAYAEAVQTARRSQATGAPAAVVRSDSVTGRITPASPRPATGSNGTSGSDVALVASQSPTITPADEDAQKAACPAPASTVTTPARADRGKLVAGTNRHTPPPRVKQKETLVSRLGSMFRPVGYHNRGTGNNPDPYSHP
jgi:hypothetical protein